MNELRVIFYLGKGGVGKTVVSLASAVRCAELGYKTLVISTDVAHNLADFLDQPVGFKPTLIADNLWAQEINTYADIDDSLSSAQTELSQLIKDNRIGDIAAEEVAAFPGLDEFGSLSNIIREIKDGDFQRIIIDTPATGSTIRMLSLPDSFRWYANYLQKAADHRLVKVALPLVGVFIKKPAQMRAAFSEKEAEVTFLQTILRNADICSFRVVLQPERTAVRESERLINYLSLYDYPIDCLIMNRVLAGSVESDLYTSRQIREAQYLESWESESKSFPLRIVPEYNEEIVGVTALSSIAAQCFASEDPGKIFSRRPPHELIADQNGHYILKISMPFMTANDVRLSKKGHDLFIIMGNFKREFVLPDYLDSYVATKGFHSDGLLTILFEQSNNQ